MIYGADSVSVVPTAPAAAVPYLLSTLFRYDRKDPKRRATELRQLADLLGAVELLSLSYDDDYRQLTRVAELLESRTEAQLAGRC